MSRQKPFSLFVYGTLMNRSVFRAVLGRRLVPVDSEVGDEQVAYARRAVLHGYKKVSPDNTYLYAVPDPHGRIRGYLVGPLPGECMAALRRYEGRNYSRRTVRVSTGEGPARAVAFVGNVKQLEHAFGYAFRDRFKQEILLGRKIDAALLETEREQLHTEADTTRRAVGELRGPAIRDVIRKHFESGGISDYAIRHSLKDEPLGDFSRIIDDPEARALAPDYLALVIRQVIFNQFEERIRRDLRYELDHIDPGPEYYEHAVSSLAALHVLNAQSLLLDMLVADCLTDLSFAKEHLVDFVNWAVVAADAIYDRADARQEVEFIRNHTGRGFIPLGAELEFSNIGHSVISDPQGQAVRDARYDGFIYFRDFGLDALTWKLGGHLDDHHEKACPLPRRGFFEAALGNVSIQASISKPVTDDPWLLNQLIHAVRRFYEVTPHSVHVSLQLRSQHRPNRDRLLPLPIMQCLFALAGDPAVGPDGRLRIRRLVTEEITAPGRTPPLLFSEINRRHSTASDGAYPHIHRPRTAGRYVQQFRFLRLARDLNYEPIVMGLKGLQISLRPGTFLTPAQHQESPKHRRAFEALLAWGEAPHPIDEDDVATFLRRVREGLLVERRGKPAHSEAYINWSLDQLRDMLAKFNALAGGCAQPQHEGPVPAHLGPH